MSDKDYGFDLDDILREFSSDSDKPKASPAAQPKPKAVQPKPAAQSRPAVTQQRPAAQPKPVTAQPRPAAPQQRQQPVQRPAQPVQQRPAQPVQQRPAAPQQKPAAAQSQRPAAAERRPVPVPAERRPVPAAPAPRAKEKSAGMGFITLVFIALGLICGSLLSERQVGGICGALLTNLSAWLSGAWFDLKLIGGGFEAFAYALPFANAVDAARSALAGRPAGMPLLLTLAYAIALSALASTIFARRMRRS